MGGKLKIFNGNILTPYRLIRQGTVVVSGGKIVEVSAGNIDVPDAEEIDAKGNYIAPGFIDMHVHGGGGHDFMDGSENAFLKIAETHAQYGTTAMLPTTLTAETEELYKTLELYEQANRNNTAGAQFLGIHLEGPYFAMSQRGAQDPRYIRNPDPKEYKAILSRSSSIKRWSAAPELEGAIEFAHYLKSKGILVALAHTDALYDETLLAFENGYTLATHFYSCMTGVTRKNALRYAGVVESAYLIDEMDVEVIADGIHCPPPLLKLICKIKGTDRMALITDSMRAAGMPEGNSILGSLHDGLKVIVEDGVAKLPDRTSFAGSVATADRLVRTMVKEAEIPLLEAVRMITNTPASILGITDRKGTLIPGKDADIVIFDGDIQVQKTIVNGRVIFDKELDKQNLELALK
ncbi:N-acetylglucosamine 6-phosphate deacetylase [Flammeovirgaceae bacterium 311]|nr:N-acetylglucosamine 6-phosphate deacetylase [Flammeovirgaceae bacterium 311]